VDVGTFAADLLEALADSSLFERVDLQTEGPLAQGFAYVDDDLFLRFHFNESTQTIAFALIKENNEKRRIWGVDRDNRRGWHTHPVENPDDHVEIDPLPVKALVARLREVLLQWQS